MKNRLEIGEALETEIVAITDSTIFLDLSAKSEGVLDRAELADENGNVSVKEGDKITVYFTGEVRGEMRFTTKISGGKADKSMIENAYKNAIPVEGKVEAEIKGGFEVKIGTNRAFCPYSQMGFKKKEEPAFYVGKILSFVMLFSNFALARPISVSYLPSLSITTSLIPSMSSPEVIVDGVTPSDKSKNVANCPAFSTPASPRITTDTVSVT